MTISVSNRESLQLPVKKIVYHLRKWGKPASRKIYNFFHQKCIFLEVQSYSFNFKLQILSNVRIKPYSYGRLGFGRLDIIFHGFRPKLKKSLKYQFSAVFLIKYKLPIVAYHSNPRRDPSSSKYLFYVKNVIWEGPKLVPGSTVASVSRKNTFSVINIKISFFHKIQGTLTNPRPTYFSPRVRLARTKSAAWEVISGKLNFWEN